MTTIVTRLYENPAHADAAVATLKGEGFPESAMDVIEQRSRVSAQDQIAEAGVPGSMAQQYAQHLTSNRALLVVRAPFVPFGAARRAIEVADMHPSFNAGVADENLNLPDQEDASRFLSVLRSHRLFVTNHLDVRNGGRPRGFSRSFQIPMLSERGKRMRPAVVQRGPIVPLRALGHRRITGAKVLMDRFFAGFMLPHISHREPPRMTRHRRFTI